MKNIPNFITCLNLFSGCISCVLALTFGNYVGALIFILLASVFDFLDGFFARLLKSYSPIGAQLDSLADLVSFGVAPGFIVYSFLLNSSAGIPYCEKIYFLAFLIPIFAAVRLAKFNIDTRQKSSFLGLPVPANGLFWGSLIQVINLSESNQVFFTVFIAILIIIFCLLMVSELPMYSLKFTHFKWKGNEYPYITIVVALILISYFLLFGICLIVTFYIFLSLIKYLLGINKKK